MNKRIPQSLYRQMHHVHPYSMYVFLQLITDGSPNKHPRKGEEENASGYLQKKQYVNNFWIRIVNRKWGSQIDKFLTTLYIKRIQFEVHKRVPPMSPMSCQILCMVSAADS